MCEEKNYEAKSNSKETMMDEITAVKKKLEDLSKEAKIKETQGVKRKPLSDGTLELTESELEEFKVLFDWQGIIRLKFDGTFLHAEMETQYVHSVNNVKAILYLAERFDLGEDK